MSLFVGVVLGIAVNFLWGVAFLIPHALPAIDPVSITVGRYASYGVLSVCLVLVGSSHALRLLRARDWLWALAFAFTGNVGYYVVLVLAIRMGSVSVAALIVGTLPVSMALYGNWSEREIGLGKLLVPLALILGGLITMNGYKLASASTVSASRDLGMGILCAVIALGLWTWYGVQNARYMKRRTEIDGSAWSAAIGVGTLVLTVAALPVLALTGMWSPAEAFASIRDSGSGPVFLAASLILGVIVSWLATVLWNISARRLPVALAAQLIVFETLSSVFYGALVDGAPPPMLDMVCIVVILSGVLLGIRAMLRLEASAA